MKEINIINNLRVVSCETISNAKSGHPGVALSAAPIFYAIYKNLKYDKFNDKYFNRDFFVNSAGHSSALNYCTLNLFDLQISKQDLLNFRKLNSKTPGHPEISTPFIDCSTGPLGQGIANSVGIALAQKHYAAIFNQPKYEIFNSHTFCFVGDGCLMEGVGLEALSLASKLNLNNLIFVYDHNSKTIEGDTSITLNEDIALKFKAMNFNVLHVKDGNKVELIEKAIIKAKTFKNKPTIILIDTKIGFGSHLEDNELSHGKPFSDDEINLLKQKLNVSNIPFEFNNDIKEYINEINKNKQKIIVKEQEILKNYKKEYPKLYKQLQEFYNFKFNEKALKEIEKLNKENNLSTRENNHIVLNELAKVLNNLIGGSADVCTSTLAYLKNEKFINEDFKARNIHFGIREHAMAGICNGLALFGGLLPYASCYLSFSDYLKPALRMTALMNLPLLYMFSHDNIFVGEDGPTHQPIEQLVSLRATPNTYVFRPYNITELFGAYKFYLENLKPTCLILSKEKVTNSIDEVNKVLKGGYIVFKEQGELKGVILSSGVEVETAIEVAKNMEGIRVVSIPCFELFDEQTKAYKNNILTDKPKIVMELSSSYSYYKYCDNNSLFITTDSFGKSGNGKEIKEFYEFTPTKLIKKIKKFLK